MLSQKDKLRLEKIKKNLFDDAKENNNTIERFDVFCALDPL